MRRLTPILVCLLALPVQLGASAAGAASIPAGTANLVVDADTLWSGESRTVGGIVVASGATLELRGTQLRVLDRILVEKGGTLSLGPLDGEPTRLMPANVTTGFWLDIQGTLTSAGTPRTIIEGLAGKGLETVVMLPGGLKINGTADLRDVWIRNGTAGIVVQHGASLKMADARMEHLFLMGVAILGTAEFDRVESVDNIIGITGRGGACRVTVRNSTLANWGGNFQMVGCPATIEDSHLDRANTNLFSGGAPYLLRNVLVTGYKHAGIRAEEGARMTLQQVQVHGDGQALLGIDLEMRNDLVARDLEVTGNSGNGLQMQAGKMQLDGVRLAHNGGFGLQLVNAEVPDLSATDFGERDSATRNGKGPVGVFRQFTATASSVNGTPASRIGLQIFDAQGREVYNAQAPLSTLTAAFDTYANGTDGRGTPAGPFRYRVTSDVLAEPAEGPVDLDYPMVHVRRAAPPEPVAADPAWRLLAVGLGVALLAFALVRRGREKAGKAKQQADLAKTEDP